MIFSDNYDKLIQAQSAYNAEIKKYPELVGIDDVTDFFGVAVAETENQFKAIYDHLTTFNTVNSKIVNYSAVSEDSIKGHSVKRDLIKQGVVSADFLNNEANLSMVTMPNLVINYTLNNKVISIAVNGKSLVSTIRETVGNETVVTTKVAYVVRQADKQFVVVREQVKRTSPTAQRIDVNDFLINKHTKEIVYVRNASQLQKTDGFNSQTKNIYIVDGGEAIFVSKLNGDKPVMLSVDSEPIIFNESLTQINDYNDYFSPNFSQSLNFSRLIMQNKIYAKVIDTTSRDYGFGTMFSNLATKKAI